jgi:rfaE bifunctional protein nucleotidyltransferase chain/domain
MTQAAAAKRKVVTREALLAALKPLRAQGKTVVTTNGCFDLLHIGHLDVLEAAAAKGDILVVGVNADATVTTLKGPGRPLASEEQRARLLAALECVDYVVIFPEPDPIALIEAIRPDVHVKGGDYGPDIVEADAVRAGGGRVEIVPVAHAASTSGLIATIRRSVPNASEGIDH